MKSYKFILLYIFIVAAGLLAGGLYYKATHHPSQASSSTEAAAADEASYYPTAGKEGTKTIKVQINENKIVGNSTITVSKGDSVHLIFTGGEDQESGDVLLTGYDLTVPTTKRYTTSMEFKALKTGSFPIKLSYEDEERELAEQRDDTLGESPLHTAVLGTFVVR